MASGLIKWAGRDLLCSGWFYNPFNWNRIRLKQDKEISAIDTVRENLAPCPDHPNCVSSQSADNSHQIAPLAYSGATAAAMRRLRGVIEAMPRTKIISAGDDGLHAEFKSALLGFVDDVHCLPDPAMSVIHIRSASRLGSYDFGVNRKRVETIRAAFAKAGQ
jgi:uncharacterized protein (DUF1499 family)